MMDAISEADLLRIERDNPRGLSSEAIVEFFTARGVKFTESTLRKYVQWGLLPRSRRVAIEGKKCGSVGMYPAVVVRRVQRLKEMLATHSIDEIRGTFLIVRADVEELERTLERIFATLDRATKTQSMLRELDAARMVAADLLATISAVEKKLTTEAPLYREAG